MHVCKMDTAALGCLTAIVEYTVGETRVHTLPTPQDYHHLAPCHRVGTHHSCVGVVMCVWGGMHVHV